MYGDTSNLDEVRKRLDSVSPSFCMAKWMHTTLHLMNGRTHSCYLPETHKIPLDEIAKNPSALHNTSYKKEQRRKMKCGERPGECGICWSIEDLPGNKISDRILRGAESWTRSHFEQVKNMPWDQDINPSYMEVSFSYLCNFKCSYCSPYVSSKWHEDIKKNGPYLLPSGAFQDVEYFKELDVMPIEDEDTNPYIKSFWQWWPELYKSLKIFRITGGEPLLSKHTFKILDWLNEHPSDIELDINSNFGVPDGVFKNFLDKVGPLVTGKKIRSLRIHTSIDTYGRQAEYIRSGLNFKKFENNLKTYLEAFPKGGLAFMCTFNALSVVNFPQLLEWYRDLKSQYGNGNREIYLDIPHLVGPEHQSVRILTPDYAMKVQEAIQLMGELKFRPMEIEKLNRIHKWMSVPQEETSLKSRRKDFYSFFSEYDRRNHLNFLDYFPEMTDFWNLCKTLE